MTKPELFCRSRGGLPWRRVGSGPTHLLVGPETMVLLGPVDIDRAAAHRLEGAFHTDRPDIDMPEHRSDPISVIAEECPPALGRWVSSPAAQRAHLKAKKQL